MPKNSTYAVAAQKPYIALGLAVLGLGFSPIFIRWANAPAIVTNFYRMIVGLVLLAWPFYRQIQTNGWPSRRGLQLALLAGVFFAFELSLWGTGVLISGASNPTLLANAAPVWVGLGAVLFLKERLSRLFWIGLALTVVGTTVILGVDSLRTLAAGPNILLGSVFGLLAGVFYGVYMLITQRGRAQLDVISFFWLAAFGSMVTFFVLCLFFRYPFNGYTSATYWSFLAYGLVAQVFGYLAVNYALGHLPASIVSPSLLGQAVMTVIYANLLLGERLTFWQGFGIVGVLFGTYLVHRSR